MNRSIPIGDNSFKTAKVSLVFNSIVWIFLYSMFCRSIPLDSYLLVKAEVASIDEVLFNRSLASVIYPFVPVSFENIVMNATVQLLTDDPDSPILELLTQFIRANTFDGFTTQMLLLVQWVFDEVRSTQFNAYFIDAKWFIPIV